MLKKLNGEEYITIINRIEKITGKTAPEITIRLCESKDEYITTTYGNIRYIPDYMRVTIDFEKHVITTYDAENINLYIFYLIYGKFNNMHVEWYQMLLCYSKFEFRPSFEIQVEQPLPFPDLIFADNKKYGDAKAKKFAEMTEQYGFEKMIQWLESPDLLYYYPFVFKEEYQKRMDPVNISNYEKVLRGEIPGDENTRLALWIDDPYKADSYLDVFYASAKEVKAAVKYNESVLGIVKFTSEGVTSYVTDYSAWMRRRAAGYARNNPYDEKDFMEKVLSFSKVRCPKILEIGIGSGRIAKPFVEGGYDYYGIDILYAMLNECKEVLGSYKNLHIQKHNIMTGLPFENHTFDILIESRVLDVENNPFLMNEIKRVLRPGGTAFIGVQDNMELHRCNSDEYNMQSYLIWEVYKNAWYNQYNISDKRTHNQNLYDLELPKQEMELNTILESNEGITKPVLTFTREHPFSICEYEYDFIQNLYDNKYHMAFFRLEPLYEPCGSDFFAALEETARQAFGNVKGKCTRATELRVYQFDHFGKL